MNAIEVFTYTIYSWWKDNHHQCKFQRVKTISGTTRSRVQQPKASSTRAKLGERLCCVARLSAISCNVWPQTKWQLNSLMSHGKVNLKASMVSIMHTRKVHAYIHTYIHTYIHHTCQLCRDLWPSHWQLALDFTVLPYAQPLWGLYTHLLSAPHQDANNHCCSHHGNN